ncbi:prostatic acid phosphatase-like [Sitodiplosis mosellana]|uniref:prostatic acid phosphatase-like n=1 Tax=Sitodiplosis mosellana TaxID=263140 RepID=UPI0024438F6C|nr:prostatic acid phosphatase-like [Sitodiplosis mosellana]
MVQTEVIAVEMCLFQSLILTVSLFSCSNANIFTCPKRSDDVFKVLNSSESELIFAHVIYRHGDRTIGHLYPNDPWREEIHWPEGYGALTNEGKRRHYKLGKFFMRRYGEILGHKYSPNKVYVRSSDYDRTIMSAQANLAGMFRPTDDEIWNEDIGRVWQPIPIHVVPLKSEYLIANERKCPKFEAMFAKHEKESPEIQRIYSQYADQFLHWTQESGANITTFREVKELYKTLLMERARYKTLPAWAEKAIERNGVMGYISKYHFKMRTDTPQLARLSTGFLIKEIFERFSKKINKTLQPDRSVWVYSAHDDTVANLLNSFGLFEIHIPPYASSILLELYKNDENEHYIQMFYRKSDVEKPSPLNIPNCGEKCTLDRLYELYSELIPGDFETECRWP